jgi:hypothetical protein
MGAVEVKKGKEVEATTVEKVKTVVEKAKESEETAKIKAKEIIAEAEKAKLAAKDQTKRLITQAEKAEKEAKIKAKEIITEAEKAKLAAKDEAKRIIAEAEKAEKEAKIKAKEIITEAEKAKLAAKQRAKMETEEAKRAREFERWAKERVNPAIKEKTKTKQAETIEQTKGAGICEGVVRILVSGVNSRQFKKLEDNLRLIEDLDILVIGGSVAVGTEFIVSADKPIPLVNALEEMQFVERVTEHGKTIQVTLRAE